ncbi:taste receptor type 2 member 40-like [Mantella aurantiaca]
MPAAMKSNMMGVCMSLLFIFPYEISGIIPSIDTDLQRPTTQPLRQLTARMWSLNDIIRLVYTFFCLVSGVTLNFYIVTVYVREWRRKKAFNVCDKIVLLLALSGIVSQCTCTIENLQYFFGSLTPHIMKQRIHALILHIFLMSMSFWNTAWLSIYYCLKLVKCSHRTLLQVKSRLSSSITQLLIVSLVALFFMTLPLPWTVQILSKNITRDPSGLNHTDLYIHIDVRYVPLYMVYGSLLPFLLIFICIGLSVMSLLSHVQHIRHNSSQFSSSPQLEGHLRAVRTMILQVSLCLALYLTVFSMILFSSYIGIHIRLFLFVIVTSYPSAQALISIQGNPKLRNKPPARDTTSCSN